MSELSAREFSDTETQALSYDARKMQRLTDDEAEMRRMNREGRLEPQPRVDDEGLRNVSGDVLARQAQLFLGEQALDPSMLEELQSLRDTYDEQFKSLD